MSCSVTTVMVFPCLQSYLAFVPTLFHQHWQIQANVDTRITAESPVIQGGVHQDNTISVHLLLNNSY